MATAVDGRMTKAMNALPVPVADGKEPKRCLSCGTTENIGRRRYCTLDCRQKLRQRLDMRCGLLQALNTRYATFYFSDLLIVMDLLPRGQKEILSFFYPCLLYTSDAADDLLCVDLGGRRIIKKKKKK